MIAFARSLSVVGGALLASAALVGCAMDHTAGSDAATEDAGRPPIDTGRIARSCADTPLVAGQPCDFAAPCTTYWDFFMGYCGQEVWTCSGGLISYSDQRFACGMDAGADAPPPATWCEGYVAPPAATTDDCRDDDDCEPSHGGTCWAPGDTAGHHFGGTCPMDCASDPDCAPGDVCVPFNEPFGCHQCIPACTETSCPAWEACGDDGHCRPALCETDGYPCAPGSHCAAPGDTTFDSHHCTLAPCTADADCGCGACVEGFCALGPGRCDLPRP
jgi:hypothetical protein